MSKFKPLKYKVNKKILNKIAETSEVRYAYQDEVNVTVLVDHNFGLPPFRILSPVDCGKRALIGFPRESVSQT